MSLELPRREAADMDVVLVEPAAAVLLELDLEFLLGLGNGQAADGAWGTDTWTSPCTVRFDSGELSMLDGCTGLRAKSLFIRHGGLSKDVTGRGQARGH